MGPPIVDAEALDAGLFGDETGLGNIDGDRGGPLSGGLAALSQAIGGGSDTPRIHEPAAVSKKRGDARVLPVQFDAHGQRYGTFRDAVQNMEPYRWEDQPVPGGQTVLLCCKLMLQKVVLRWQLQWFLEVWL